jgi:hypothetical protein
LREALAFGDTQLKVHLARLVDLELVIPHRLESGGFAYELAWHGDTDGRVLPGLLDPQLLDADTTTTADRSGSEAAWSGPGRGPVGGRSGGGRPVLHALDPLQHKENRPPDGMNVTERTDIGSGDNVEAGVVVAAGGRR